MGINAKFADSKIQANGTATTLDLYFTCIDRETSLMKRLISFKE